MESRLPCGHFFGDILRSRTVAGLVLTETRHAPGLQLPHHCHDNAYLCFVRQGSYREEFGTLERECKPLTVAFHPPGERHREEMAQAEVRSFNIELEPWWLQRVQQAAPVVIRPLAFQGGMIAHLALRLYREFQRRDVMSPLAIEGLMYELLAEAVRAAAAHRDPTQPPRWVVRAREVLHDRWAEPLSVAEVAAEVGVHPVYLAEQFRRHYRSTVSDYLRQLRITGATRLLGNADLPLAQVALQTGFADQSHFCRVFKRHTGMTPAAYRRLLAT